MHYHRWQRHGDPLGGAASRKAAPLDRQCTVDGCRREFYAKGLCDSHYGYWRKHGNVTHVPMNTTPCSVEGCEVFGMAGGMCRSHYAKWKLYGDPLFVRPVRRKPLLVDGGYRMLFRPDHPNARKSGYVPEHSVVIAEQIGRPLRKGENAHHLNGVRGDNRPENLELWVRAQPPGQRVRDLVAFANRIRAEYGTDPMIYP